MIDYTPSFEPLYNLAQPEPAALIESLRAFGYSLQTAIADLIDNSITAKARNVWVHFEWNGAESRISVKDDGEGINEAALISAVRPESQSPLAERSPKDLGRFGLGPKIQSFSASGSIFIHTDRGLTAREEGSQTVPEDYLLFGNRTQQNAQVGNAVPPLLAQRTTNIVAGLFSPVRTGSMP